jgi:hypothetical protein
MVTLGAVVSRPSAGTLSGHRREANVFVPIFPLLIITSTPVGTAVLIATVWFLSAWSPYFDPGERQHSPDIGIENDDPLL